MGIITNELSEATEHLNNFEIIHNLKSPYLPNNALEALELSYEQLSRLNAEDCAKYSYVLEQYSLYIQRVLNKESATLEWLENKLEHLVCHKLSNYSDYIKYTIKVKLISTENEVVRALLQQINFTKQKIKRLEFIPNSIKSVSKSLNDIRQTKLSIMRG